VHHTLDMRCDAITGRDRPGCPVSSPLLARYSTPPESPTNLFCTMLGLWGVRQRNTNPPHAAYEITTDLQIASITYSSTACVKHMLLHSGGRTEGSVLMLHVTHGSEAKNDINYRPSNVINYYLLL
jgi:hypothetical protein